MFIQTENQIIPRTSIVRGLDYSVEFNTIGGQEIKVAALRTNSDNRYIFAPFLIDLLELELEELDQDILTTVDQWRHQWELSVGGLNLKQQSGLFGELTILHNQIENSEADIVESWRGPEPEDSLHDFKCEDRLVEVKTTMSKPPIVRISNLEQLAPIDGVSLRLVVIEISIIGENEDNCSTLPDIVTMIRGKLDADNLEIFEEKLVLACYFDFHANWYRRVYKIDAINFCEIEQSTQVFPLILAAQLPSTVVDVKYSLKTHLLSMVAYESATFNI